MKLIQSSSSVDGFRLQVKSGKDRFSIFFDVTSYTSENVIPNSIRTMFNAMVPEDMVKNCDGVFFCNVNTEYLPFLKALIKLHYSGIFLTPCDIVMTLSLLKILQIALILAP